MYTSKVLHTISLVSLLSLPVAANARTINLFETEDGQQVVPENASSIAGEMNPYADLAAMSIEDIIKMEVNGEPVIVQVHVPNVEGEGTEIVAYSTEYPEGIVLSEGNPQVAETPVPTSAWLMMSGLLGLVAVSRRRYQGQVAA
ncbi:MAG: hypothetical protein HZB57_00065 [Gammaproteobacteria bacterium]|nr:hypothetical protein [Gammaproteobacteria bacterium]